MRSLNLSHRFRVADLLRTTALIAVIALLWCFIHNRWTAQAWNVPLFQGSDALTMLAGEKAVMEGSFPFLLPKFNPQLGAPYIANWNDWPSTEEIIIQLSGFFGRIIGLIPGANFTVLFGQILAGLSLYLVCRYLRYRWQWAFLAALIFALSPYAFQRGLPHFTLTYFWHLPLCLLVVWWCSSREGLARSGSRFWFAFAIAVLTGAQSPYYTNIFLQFLGLTALASLLRGAGRRALTPLLLIVVTLTTFLVMNADTFYYQRLHGKNPVAAYRSYYNLEIYALKPLELLIPPPTHRSGLAREIANRYLADADFKTGLPGELFFSYIGLAGICALLALGLVSIRRTALHPRQPLPLHALLITWLVLYSVVGGFNGVLGQLGLTLFRCTDRNSICVLALLLLFAVRELSRLTWKTRPLLVSASAVLILPVVLWDQLPPYSEGATLQASAQSIESDRAFAQELEAKLPSRAMVFQLPVMSFPEAWPIHQMGDYEHLRPFLFTSKLRYSYGTNKGRGDSDWQLAISRLPAAEMAAALEAAGFDAVYINRKGYPDSGAALLAGLKAAGHDRHFESPAGDLVAVPLTPSQNPLLPERPPTFTEGWYAEEGDNADTWRYSSGNGTVVLHNSASTEKTHRVSFQLSSPSKRTVQLLMNGQLLYESPMLSNVKVSQSLDVSLPPGETTLQFVTEPAVKFPGNPDTRLLGFRLFNFRDTPAPAETTR